MEADIQVLRDAGLRPSHVARLLDVSSVTVLNWYNQSHTPHRWITDRVRALATAVRKAVEEGKLPVSAPGLNADEQAAKTFFVASRYFRAEDKEGDTAN